MAAAIVPLIAGVAPQIISLIAALVQKSAPIQETNLGSGTGPVKFAAVFADVISALQQAAAAGQIDKTLPADPTVQLIIQAVISSMKLAGQLTGTPPPTVPSVPISTPAANLPGTLQYPLLSGKTLIISVT